MREILIAIAALMGHPDAGRSDPVALVLELGSGRFAEREAAEAALSRLGRSALPALRAAAASKDPEIQTRASAILRRIEGALLVEPSLIDLDFHATPLPAAVMALNRQSGLQLALAPELPAVWNGRSVTVRSGGPIPFWKAIDAFCGASQLHYMFGGPPNFEHGESTFALYDGFATGQGLFDDRGPFRVQLASLQYQSEVHLATETPDPARSVMVGSAGGASVRSNHLATRQFFAQLLVGAEPRLAVAPGGVVKLLEATDDQGRSLLLPTRSDTLQHESGYLGVTPSPLVHARVDLAYPAAPAARLKKIRGLIPLVVSTRRPEPLAISLGKAANQTFRQGKVAITVGEVKTGAPDQAATIDLVIKLDDPTADADEDDPGSSAIREVASPQQLEVLDDHGRMIPWFPSSSFFNGEEARLTLTLLDRGAAPAAPATVRYHGVIRARTEVPFEFRDLPMP